MKNNDIYMRIFGVLSSLFYVLIYLVLTLASDKLYILGALVHIPFLIASALFITGILSIYTWVNKSLYLSYMSLSTIIAGTIQCYFFNNTHWDSRYMIIVSELLSIIVVIGVGCSIGVVVSLPMKLIQMFFYDTALYEDDNAKVKTTELKSTAKPNKRDLTERYKIIISGMDKFQLEEELESVVKSTEYEKAALVRDELRKR